MIRLRSQKLLSGVSTLAVLAAFGAADPALAGQTITSAGNPNAPVTNAVSDNFIDVQAGSTIQADAQGRSIFNSGTLTSFLSVNNGVLTGSISNSGTITGTGVSIFNTSTVSGGIINTGTIDLASAGEGISIANSIVNGGIHNNGASALIRAFTDGILLTGNTVLNGGITNSGTIAGKGFLFSDAISLEGAGVVLNGGIVNAAGGTISAITGTFTGRAINLQTFAAFIGDIDNSGTISSSGGTISQGVNMAGGVLAGSIINRSTGTITATSGTGVNISGGTLTGDIDNAGTITGDDRGIQLSGGTIAGKILNRSTGTISATTTGGVAINITGGTLTQGIDNQGDILADVSSGIAINVTGGAFNGGITNTGLVSATGANGVAINIAGVTFNGGVNNSGTIQAAGTALKAVLSTVNGGITNDGTITSNSAIGVNVALGTLNGGFQNDGSISGSTSGVSFGLATVNGDIVNNDSISGGSTGLALNLVTLNGNISNDGSISGATNGLVINSSTVGDISNTGSITGNSSALSASNSTIASITNDGTITGSGHALFLGASTVTGDITNTGDILGDSNFGSFGAGIYISGGSVGGQLINSGNIYGGNQQGAILVDGGAIITGGIANSGAITSTGAAIDLVGAGAGHTITQTDGLIQGPTALNLNNGFIDIIDAQGGEISGDIVGDGTEDFRLNAAGQFAYSSGAATGLDHFDPYTSGTFLLGTDERGVDGAGVQVTADHLRTQSAGIAPHIYLDDNTTLTFASEFNLANAGATTGTLEYFLTTTTGTHGVINAGPSATLDGTIAAFLDPTTFATAALATGVTLTYTGVIQSGGLTGTFDNVGNILVTSNPFFVGNVVYNGGNVDLTIQRLGFNNALIAVTQNQKAVGGALEQVYDNLVLSTDMTNAFASLFNSATTAEVQAKLDELSGSQHAQVLQTAQSLSGMVNTLVEERLDGVLISQDGVRYAGTPGQRYAQAVAVASDAASSGLRGSQGLTRGGSGASVWLRGFGNWVNVDQDPEADGYQQDSTGLIGGVDFAINNNATVGGAVAYAQTDVDFNTPPDNADIDTWQVNVFGSYGFGRFYADGQASYGWHDVSATRSIDLGPPAGSALASSGYDASTWSVNGEVGSIWRLGRVNMQPSAGLSYASGDVDGFTETGPAYALSVSGSSSESFASTLALRASGQWMMGQTQVVPDIKLGWRHEFGDERQSFTATFLEDPTAPMSIVSSAIQPDSMILSTGATFGVTKNFEVFFDVNGQYNADASATNASGGLRFTW